jgi:hypothetical protein
VGVPIEWGDVPTWLQGIGGLAQVGHVVWTIQMNRARALVDGIRDSSNLDDDEIAARIEAQPQLASLLLHAIEEAMRARTDEQLQLLAKVIAAAVAGDDARIDASAVYLRTAGGLDPADLRVLTAIATPAPDLYPDSGLVGARRQSDLAERLPNDQQTLLLPIVSALTREGLIEDVALGTVGYQPAWRATAYAFEFLRFLPNPPVEWRHASLAAVARSHGLVVRNLGMVDAELTTLSATIDGRSLCRPLTDAIPIPAGWVTKRPMNLDLPANGVVRIRIEWTDGTGPTRTVERSQPARTVA